MTSALCIFKIHPTTLNFEATASEKLNNVPKNSQLMGGCTVPHQVRLFPALT